MLELSPHDVAHGGEAVARLNGKAYFIPGAMPGETVRAEVVKEKGSWARMRLVEVLDASPDRLDPPCPHFASCGGCNWQYAGYEAQRSWKQSIVTGQLSHLGRVKDPVVGETVAPGPPYRYRNRMDFSIREGSPALHERRSDNLVPLDTCHILIPALLDLFNQLGDLDGVERLTLRAGATTGERLIAIDGKVPAHAEAWDAGIVKFGAGPMQRVSGPGHVHEKVAGVTFRITGRTFFQNNTDGAEHLVRLVIEALEPRESDTLLDAYAGGGLFAATVGSRVGRVIAIEGSATAVNDLRANLAGAGVAAKVRKGRVTDALHDIGEYWDLAICDPPRTGLGAEGVEAITSAMPRRIAYVSCDPASLARDTRMIVDAGYQLAHATPVDMFPQTYHVETVAAFHRTT